MTRSGSVCVLTLVFMCSVCAELNPLEYLFTYGYLALAPDGIEKPTFNQIMNATLKFQSFNGLPESGVIDETTFNKMRVPRCGVKDINPYEYRATSKWRQTLITWKITKYNARSSLSPNQQRDIMRQAFKRWADVTSLIIHETRGSPTIEIRFEKRDHGDGYPFDGKGGILAHTFPPEMGAAHFDGEEDWMNGNTSGIDLETMATHEFGHALGLDHSAERNSVMSPFYDAMPTDLKLHSDDVAGVQNLYGQKPIGDSHFCNYSYKSLDAVMRISGNDFVFVDNGEVIDGRTGQKMAVQKLFHGGPDWVQAAAYSKGRSKAYLFKNDKVWAYYVYSDWKFSLVGNFPKYISNRNIHHPECALQYNIVDECIFLLKETGLTTKKIPTMSNPQGTRRHSGRRKSQLHPISQHGFLFEFMAYFEDVSPDGGDDASKFFDGIPNKLDAAISSDHEIIFIVEKQAFHVLNNKRVLNNTGVPSYMAFNKCPN